MIAKKGAEDYSCNGMIIQQLIEVPNRADNCGDDTSFIEFNDTLGNQTSSNQDEYDGSNLKEALQVEAQGGVIDQISQ